MRGKKAKALQLLAGYHPHRDRLAPPPAATGKHIGTVVLHKHSTRKAYKFIKRRYGMLPVGMVLQRLRVGMAMMEGA
jgi:hypothetical protein